MVTMHLLWSHHVFIVFDDPYNQSYFYFDTSLKQNKIKPSPGTLLIENQSMDLQQSFNTRWTIV